MLLANKCNIIDWHPFKQRILNILYKSKGESLHFVGEIIRFLMDIGCSWRESEKLENLDMHGERIMQTGSTNFSCPNNSQIFKFWHYRVKEFQWYLFHENRDMRQRLRQFHSYFKERMSVFYFVGLLYFKSGAFVKNVFK